MIVKKLHESNGYRYTIHKKGILYEVGPWIGQGEDAWTKSNLEAAIESYFREIGYGYRRGK